MKKLCGLLLVVSLSFCFGGCAFYVPYKDPVLDALPPYKDRVFYSSDGFQDFAEYAKYTYEAIDDKTLSQTGYFKPCTDEDTEEILEYIDHFELWVETLGEELEENYDFDKTMISTDDYFYLESKYDQSGDDETYYNKFESYRVYYFDIDGQTLYYFHNKL